MRVGMEIYHPGKVLNLVFREPKVMRHRKCQDWPVPCVAAIQLRRAVLPCKLPAHPHQAVCHQTPVLRPAPAVHHPATPCQPITLPKMAVLKMDYPIGQRQPSRLRVQHKSAAAAQPAPTSVAAPPPGTA